MKAYEVQRGARTLDALRLVERAKPSPGSGQVLVRVRAASLNFRDLAVVQGRYPGPPDAAPHVPLSDGAGEVVGLGEGVVRFKIGDKIAATFFQTWISGAPGPMQALGGPGVDGIWPNMPCSIRKVWWRFLTIFRWKRLPACPVQQ